MGWQPYEDIEVYTYYLGEVPILGKLYRSPLRDDGERPSFCLKQLGKTIIWGDFGKIKIRPDIKKNAIGLVMQIEGIDDKSAVGFITDHILPALSESNYDYSHISNYDYDNAKPVDDDSDDKLEIRKWWKPFEYDYWKGLDFRLIQQRGIFPLYKYQKQGKKTFVMSTEHSPAFVYIIDKKYKAFKIYRPLDLYIPNKWISKRIGRVIEGYRNLPESIIENLIITSSTKDGITVMSSIPNVWSINPTSEVVWKNVLANARDINARARNVYVWLDADATGHDMTLDICSKTGWNPILVDRRFKSLGMKDQFDIFKIGGRGLVNHFFSYYKSAING